VLRYDTRGHGRTAVTHGPYTVEQLAQDVVRLLDALRLERVHFCGLSLGGMTGMWLGVHAAKRLEKLALCNTAAQIGAAEMWNARIEKARAAGMKPIAASVVERWFTPEFRARSPQAAGAAQRMIENTPPEGYAGCCAAVRDADLRQAIAAIRVPTLIIAGARDPATSPADGRLVASRIAGSQYAQLDAAHLSNIEAPAEFNSTLIRFLKS
jgi:3-oxoadipate enol-lactonase